MGHSRSGIFMAYLNELVNCDTQSVFLRTSTRDALIALSTNSSLTRDPSALQGLTREQLQQVENNQELMRLEQAHNTIIENNYHKRATTFESNASSVLPERKALTALEFKNWDVSAVLDKQLVEDCIQSLELRLALDRLAVSQHLTRTPKSEHLTQSDYSDFLIQTSTGMECPECLGDVKRYSEARKFCYSSKYALQNHLKSQHIRYIDFFKTVLCDYSGCKALLLSLIKYYHHVTMIHSTQLSKNE
ncbi:hypothetical protein AJ78_08955 [Emergomyces pasteurianus Ep9510]|uniref:Uncharacterized protein n=1 Tax=Emergomyces pasteurianus Ep9510 TaxID=1447872 RepID=A0A1J9PPF5_9EURO|nr:hypothetical protein AJ78_08955 [Emergomyces pasteurianus Ep9510]